MRIAVVGPIGSGKTVLAGRLAERLALPNLCLDGLYWERDWRPAPPAVFHERVREALAGPRWVAEGVHGAEAADLLWRRAELVVWLDLPRWLCAVRVLRRSVGNVRYRRLLWGTNVETWRRVLSRDSVVLAAVRHHPIGQRECRDRAAAAPPARLIRLRDRRAVAAWLASTGPTATRRAA